MSDITIRIPVSPEQEEVIALHLLKGTVLGMVEDERAWMLTHARNLYPGCTIKAADLDIGEGEWVLDLEV